MFSVALAALLSSPTFLSRAHSHNDYLQARPLDEALDNVFASVEADLFLVDGKLLVAHDRRSVTPSKTFESMYLGPIAARMRENKGWVYPGVHKTFWVLVDQKADGAAVYAEVKRAIADHPEFKSPNIRFVISGDRPVDSILGDKGRWAGLDGRWGDIGKGISKDVMPWVSEDWTDHFKWNGSGPFSTDEARSLASMVRAAHKGGYKLRFWGAPDTPEMWEIQWKAGVDWINTDHLSALRAWMLKK